MGWIGVDLDGTLAQYGEFKGRDHIGEPIAPMLDKVKKELARGKEVRIMTARADDHRSIEIIKKWLVEVAGLPELEVTNKKDYQMEVLWDDRCREVVPNTGRFWDEVLIERLKSE
jgi:hypothetical protein